MLPVRIPTVLIVSTAVLAVLTACTSAKSGPAVPVSSSVVVTVSTVPSEPAGSAAVPNASPTTAAESSLVVTRTKPAVRPTTTKQSVPPGNGTDPLTGGRLSLNPVIAAKIDNTYFQVAQFGVAEADVVFVEQVEGGLTRLIAIFHSNLPAEVGPIRSVRSTDAQLLPVFGKPGLVFSGGAGGPLTALAATPIVDTTNVGDAYFRSDLATGTYNLHADLSRIADQAKGLSPAKSIGLNFSASPTQAANGTKVGSVQVVMQAGETDFAYTGEHFVRLRHGEPVKDYSGKVQAADNVVVQHIVDEPDGTVDSIGSPSYLSKTVGSGKVTLYRDGRTVQGTWKRGKNTAAFSYSDAGGRPLLFKPGRTWVLLAPQSAVVTVG